jgi:flavorubredoxin
MTTKVDEIAPSIYRLSTLVPEIGPTGFTFNQFLVDDDEPLLFHTGPRAMFPAVREAIATVLPPERLRWITFGHVEADECGAMNEFLAAAPNAQVAHGAMGCMVSLNDMADRPPRPLDDGEVIETGAKRFRHIDTPHAPHGWEARVLFEETTGTLFAGDLFTHLGDGPALTDADILGPAGQAEDMFRFSSLAPTTPATVEQLAKLAPTTMALMHGSSYSGDCAAALATLAADYRRRIAAAA